MIEEALGVTLPIFIGVTLLLMGGAAFLTGQAVASTWRPRWHAIVYCVLLALSGRFLSLALFYGDPFFQPLAWLYGGIVDSLALVPIGLFAHAVTRVSWLERQYPWLYERSGLFTYREKN